MDMFALFCNLLLWNSKYVLILILSYLPLSLSWFVFYYLHLKLPCTLSIPCTDVFQSSNFFCKTLVWNKDMFVCATLSFPNSWPLYDSSSFLSDFTLWVIGKHYTPPSMPSTKAPLLQYLTYTPLWVTYWQQMLLICVLSFVFHIYIFVLFTYKTSLSTGRTESYFQFALKTNCPSRDKWINKNLYFPIVCNRLGSNLFYYLMIWLDVARLPYCHSWDLLMLQCNPSAIMCC